MRYESYGWHVQVVDDASNLDSIRAAVAEAKAETNKPSLIKVGLTHIFCMHPSFINADSHNHWVRQVQRFVL